MVSHIDVLQHMSPSGVFKAAKSLWDGFCVAFALGIWTGGLLVATILSVVTVLSLPRTWALVTLAILVSCVSPNVMMNLLIMLCAREAAAGWHAACNVS